MVNYYFSLISRSLIACCLALASLSAFADDDKGSAQAQKLLRGMSLALRTINYQGTFTYEHSGALETYRVAHVVIDNQEYERLHYLSGPDRELVRLDRASDCLGVSDLILRGQLGNLFKQYPGLGEYYDISVRGEDRVAGRDVVVVHIAPKDDYRFGQSLSLDAKTLLPLRVLILNKMQVLERFQFVELQSGDEVKDVRATPATGEYFPVDRGLSCDETRQPRISRWRFGWVPKGFAMTGSRETEGLGEMIMFTDGIANFSVFLEPVSEPQSLEALRGATVVYMASALQDGTAYRATLVGEVPLLTAKRVVASMSLEPAASHTPVGESTTNAKPDLSGSIESSESAD